MNYTDDIERKLEFYERGLVLRTIPTDAWEIIKDTLHSYVEDIDQQVRKLRPGDPTLIAQHASLYVACELEEKFLQDTEVAVEFSNHPSEDVKEYLMGVRESRDVLKQQGE